MATKKTYPMIYGSVKQRFAQSVVVGDLIFLSGSSGRTFETGEVSSDDIVDQVNVALMKIKTGLENAGSNMNNIVKVQIFMRDIKDYTIIKDTEFAFYKEHAPELYNDPPASFACQVVSLSKPNMLVEFDMIAIKGE